MQTRDNIQQQAVQSLDASRTSQAGVNTDEEMTNMVEFQKAYEASAKFITAINSMLDTLIHMVWAMRTLRKRSEAGRGARGRAAR